MYTGATHKGDGTQGGFTIIITKVVTTMVTKRSCIPVDQINGFSGIVDIQINNHYYTHTLKMFIMIAIRF